MKKINFIKIALDILMSLVFVLLFNKMAIVPMTFHEIAGLAIGVVFIIHIALNFKWVRQVTLKMFSSKMNLKTKFGYIIDVLLFLCFVLIMISGILISKIVFPNFKINSSINFKMIHISISYVALLLVGIHIGLHWNWVVSVFNKIFGIRSKKKILGLIAKLAVVLLFIFGSYNIYSINYFSNVSSIAMSFNGSQPPMKDGDMNPEQNGKPGERPMKDGNHSEGGPSASKNGPTSPNALGIISTYTSVISVFSIITFYSEKLLVRRKLERQA